MVTRTAGKVEFVRWLGEATVKKQGSEGQMHVGADDSTCLAPERFPGHEQSVDLPRNQSHVHNRTIRGILKVPIPCSLELGTQSSNIIIRWSKLGRQISPIPT